MKSNMIRIGDGVKIIVVSIKGGQVRFGIRAPQDVTVLQEELNKRGFSKNLHGSAGKGLE